MTADNLRRVLEQFRFTGIVQDIQPYGNGHINDTYLIRCDKQDYILQRINTSIFDPTALMGNIDRVTRHLSEKIRARGGDPTRETLTIIPTKSGALFYECEDGAYRMYICIRDAYSYDKVQKPEHFYNAGRAFGIFQNDLSDFPASELTEIIPDFHNTPRRLEALDRAVDADVKNRVREARDLIGWIDKRREKAAVVATMLARGELPLRVTHNDTKYNNILIDPKTNKAVCVIDLDTVMPGSLLYDVGDALRFGANTAAEDEKALEKIQLDLDLFRYFVSGFLDSCRASITPSERELLSFSAFLLTYETGVRFLTDYLAGDTYFHIHYPEHNLIRARAQLTFADRIEHALSEMDRIVKSL
ncbi:MAG: aminoglycoside phosphotransferase family protein [Eubacteriales bacterium]|nr:aminoglycoside phosphotransferase family protein [Eubacteriales bacterium]